MSKVIDWLESGRKMSYVLYVLAISGLIYINSYVYLLNPYIREQFGSVCTYDILIYAGYKAFPLSIMPIILFAIVAEFKNEFNSTRVVRRIYIHKIWDTCCKRLVILSLKFAISITLITVLVGMLATRQLSNWDSTNSYAYMKFSGFPIQTNIFILSLLLCVTMFCCIIFMGIIVLQCWWWSNTPIWGFLVALWILYYEGVDRGSSYLIGKYMMSPKIYLYGINIFWQIVYPILLDLFIFIVCRILIKRRDFLDKRSS